MNDFPPTQEPTSQEPPSSPGSSPSSKTGQNLAVITHLLSLCFFTCIPFANIIAPLILWMMKKDEYPEVDHAGKEALNFQISVSICGIVLFALSFIIGLFKFLGGLLILADVIFVIIAAVQTSNGEKYKYPYSLRLMK